MTTKLQRWGNSQGIRLPKTLIDERNLNENDAFDIKRDGNAIIIKKVRKRLTFEEIIKGREDKCESSEWATGAPKGDEIF